MTRALWFLALPLLFGSGCATIVNGTTQTLEVVTVPAGATALILPEGKTVTTPASVELKRDRVHTVRLSLDGYAPEIVHLDRVASGAIHANAPNLMLGLWVDAATGAAFKLTPRSVLVMLRRVITGAGEDPATR